MDQQPTTNNQQPKEPYILTTQTVLGDVAMDSPRAAELLGEFGLHCISCFASSFDTLEMGAQVHGMSEEEIDAMVDEINAELRAEYEKDQSKEQGEKSKENVS